MNIILISVDQITNVGPCTSYISSRHTPKSFFKYGKDVKAQLSLIITRKAHRFSVLQKVKKILIQMKGE